MGIKVHKVLGYGLQDIKSEKYRVADPRFTFQGKAWDYFKELLWDIDSNEYLYWLKHDLLKRDQKELASLGIHETLLLKLLVGDTQRSKKVKKSLFLGPCLVYDPEFGFPNVMLFTPPQFRKEWQQFDSIMDWVSETYEHSQETRIYELPGGIPPYTDLQNKDGSVWDRTLREKRETAFKQGKLGEIKDNWPEIPAEVIAYLLFLGIFREDVFNEVRTQLRPYYYVYWA